MIENRIRELRKNHSMSQEALGAIINTTQQTVSKMENPPLPFLLTCLSTCLTTLMLQQIISSVFQISNVILTDSFG